MMNDFKRQILPFVCILGLLGKLTGQETNCYQSLIDEGMSLYQQQRFEAAINRLKAARGCWDKPQTDELEAYIEKVNTGYRTFLSTERDKARAAQLEAERAEAQTELANQALARQLAISEASSLTYLANLELEKGNYQDALTLAYMAYQKSDTLPIVLRTFGEVLVEARGTAVGQAGHLPIEIAYFSNQLVTITGDQQNAFAVFDQSGQLLFPTAGHKAPITDIVVRESFIASGAQDRSIHLWSRDKAALLASFGMDAPVVIVRAAPNGRHLIGGSLSGQLLIVNSTDRSSRALNFFKSKITDIHFTPDNRRFVCSSADGVMSVISIDGRLIRSLTAHIGPIWGIVSSKSGDTFYSYGADKQIKQWNRDGHLVNSIQAGHFIRELFVGRQIIAVTGNGEVLFYDQSGALKHRVQAHASVVNFASVRSETELICTGSDDNKALLLNKAGKIIQITEHNSPVVEARIAPDEKSLLTLDALGTVTLWDRQGNILLSRSASDAKWNQIRFSENGRQIWLGSRTGKGLILPNPLYYLDYLEANPPEPLSDEKQILYGIKNPSKK